MDNFVNFNSRSPQNLGIKTEKESIKKDNELNCFDDSWSDNAADAVCVAFNNMDDFLTFYKEASNQI